MPAIDCPCGHQVQAQDTDALFEACRDHMREHHPDMERTDEQIRARVDADAYELQATA